jgi:diaminopimelate epimerase
MGQANPTRSALRSLCMIGKNRDGNWVVQGPHGHYGRLFVNRAEALRFAMFDNGNPHAVVMVPGTLELNVTQGR